MKIKSLKSVRMPKRPATRSKGFSLVELLVCLAVLGILVGMALPSLAGIVDSTYSTKAKHQVQTVAQTYAAARTAGAVFRNPTSASILDALTSPPGVRGSGIFAEMSFRVNLSPEEKAAVLTSPALVVVTLPDGQVLLESHPDRIL